MLFFESISSHPDDGTCDLFVQLHPSGFLQDIRPVREWLVSEFSAVKIFDDSFYLAAENLYESDNVDSFCNDLASFIGERFPGLEFIVCPTSSVHHISVERPDTDECPVSSAPPVHGRTRVPLCIRARPARRALFYSFSSPHFSRPSEFFSQHIV